jgi:CRISPR/Cas system-associated exonuclease Cas4 (RecB family)
MIRRPGRPYVWVTWITGLLAENDHCYWRAWIKAHHHSYEKPEKSGDDSFLKEWNRKHDAMVVNRADRLRREGYEVLVEKEGKFALTGQLATVGGQPDLIALRRDAKTALIVDEKSGKRKDAQYTWQVRLYMFAKSLTSLAGFDVRGEIEYPDAAVPVEPNKPEHLERISVVMKKVAGTEEPPRVPSKWECEYCDILQCPDRYTPPPAGDATAFF